MSDHRERERKVDVSRMTVEQADRLGAQIREETEKIMAQAMIECNKMLNIYGLHVQTSYQIVKMAENTEEMKKPRKRTKKASKEQSL